MITFQWSPGWSLNIGLTVYPNELVYDRTLCFETLWGTCEQTDLEHGPNISQVTCEQTDLEHGPNISQVTCEQTDLEHGPNISQVTCQQTDLEHGPNISQVTCQQTDLQHGPNISQVTAHSLFYQKVPNLWRQVFLWQGSYITIILKFKPSLVHIKPWNMGYVPKPISNCFSLSFNSIMSNFFFKQHTSGAAVFPH